MFAAARKSERQLTAESAKCCRTRGSSHLSRLVTGTRKYERGLSTLMHDDPHWLVISQRVQYKLAVTVHRCLKHRAPGYLADYCVPVSEVPGRQHLRSARRHQLLVPRARRGTFGTRAFSVARPTVWNSRPIV